MKQNLTIADIQSTQTLESATLDGWENKMINCESCKRTFSAELLTEYRVEPHGWLLCPDCMIKLESILGADSQLQGAE